MTQRVKRRDRLKRQREDIEQSIAFMKVGNYISYEVWDLGDEACAEFTMFPSSDAKRQRYCDAGKFLHQIWAVDWNDAMTQYHKLMGWEPYEPFR